MSYWYVFPTAEDLSFSDLVMKGRLVGETPVHLFDPINDYVASELTKR